MKRRQSSFASVTLLILFVLGVSGCGGSAALVGPSVAGSTSSRSAPESSDGYAGSALAYPTTASSADLSFGSLDMSVRVGATVTTGGTVLLKDVPLAEGADKPVAGGDSPVVGEIVPSTRYQSSLMAGQVDDNAKFDDYLKYLGTYQGPRVLPIPVGQRLFVRVVDGEQRPVAGARVQLFDGERTVFDAETVSDGRVLFLPQAADATQAQQFRAIISRGQQQVEATLKAGVLDQTVALTSMRDNTGAVGLDLVFLLDSTGSMEDELDKITETVDSVAARIEQLPGSSQPRFGLVSYQDEGDSYVTKSWDFAGVQEFSRNLSHVSALGGGDYPESVNAGLRDAINLQGWADNSTGKRLRMIVLVGDAPPHLDYSNQPAYTDLLQKAVAKGIKIFPIGASGLDDQGEYIFRQFAQVTQGQFVFLTYANGVSGAPGIATNHSVSDFTVQDLDTLVVNLVAGEVANQADDTESNQQYGPQVAAIVTLAPKDFFTLIVDAVRGFTDATVSWNTAFWLLVLIIALTWARRAPQRARLASLLPRRKLAPAQVEDILIPEVTLARETLEEDGSPDYDAPQRVARVRLYVKARSRQASGQQTIRLHSLPLPPDIA